MLAAIQKKIKRKKKDDGPSTDHSRAPSVASATASAGPSESAFALVQHAQIPEPTQIHTASGVSLTNNTLISSQELPLRDVLESEQSSELKKTALGALKTFLELGALASQVLPTGLVKGVLECSSYMVKAVEVRGLTRDFIAMTLTRFLRC